MNELITISPEFINDCQVNTINARELHDFLEIGRDFSNWIKDRIDQYEFAESRDFVVFDSPNLANQNGRGGDRRSKEYHLTLDMAKELSMVERNEKGREARRYFIDCENRLKNIKIDHKTERARLTTVTRKYESASRVCIAEFKRIVSLGVPARKARIAAAETVLKVTGVDYLQSTEAINAEIESGKKPSAAADAINPTIFLYDLLGIKILGYTVNNLFLNALDPNISIGDTQDKALQMCGFRVIQRGLFIRPNLSIHLWSEKYPDLTEEDAFSILCRLPGSCIARQRLDGVTMRGIEIPTSVIISNTTEEAAA